MSAEKSRITVKLTFVIGVVIAATFLMYFIWNAVMQQESVEGKALAEARTLNIEIMATWDYIDDVQSAINYNHDGVYDFKGIYCSIAGKNIAQRFTQRSEGYTIRYARENPRSGTDEPDEFEKKALETFVREEVDEVYGIDEYEGSEVFRYVSAIELKNNCLDCHGDPEGETDITGFYKEGMAIGDLAGATSIIIPLNIYQEEEGARTFRTLLFFLVLMVLVGIVIHLSMRRWVTNPLESTNKNLEQENKTKSDTLASISHELRTPLSSIIAYTDIWNKEVEEKTAEERQIVQEIKQNSVLMLEMVNNTIDVTRIESGKYVLTYDDVDMTDLADHIMSTVKSLAVEKSIELIKQVDPDIPIIVSDWEALRQIASNLVSNAIKFTQPGGSVHIKIYTDESKKSLYIVVSDNGRGIEKDEAEIIFERYTQAGRSNDHSRPYGSGLGLYLVKSLSEQLGGSVHLETELGSGSIFTVIIPIDGKIRETFE